MSLTPCPYCDHRNEEDAKFCSACGGALGLPAHLASCLRCGAVGPVKATVCYWCSAPLPGRWRRRYSRALIGAAAIGAGVLAVVAVVGAFTYRQTPVDAPGQVSGSEAGGGAPAAAEPKSVESDASPRPGRSPAAAPVTRSPAIRPESCTEAVAAMGLCATPAQQKEAGSAAAAEAAIRRPGTTSAGKSGGQEPPPPCTEALAALGLCTPQITQRRE